MSILLEKFCSKNPAKIFFFFSSHWLRIYELAAANTRRKYGHSQLRKRAFAAKSMWRKEMLYVIFGHIIYIIIYYVECGIVTVQLMYGKDHYRKRTSDCRWWSSSTNENEITSRTQYTLDFHHVPRSFGYIKQVEKRTSQRQAFVFVFVFVFVYCGVCWFSFFLRRRRRCRRRRPRPRRRGRVLLVVVIRIYNDKDTKQYFKFQTKTYVIENLRILYANTFNVTW